MKELIYRLEFQGTDEQLKRLADISKAQAELKGQIKDLQKSGKELSDSERKGLEVRQQELRKLNKEQAETRKQLDNVAKGQQALTRQTDIGKMSLREMQKEMRLLREQPLTDKTQEEVVALNKRIGELNDASVKLRMEQESYGMDAFQSMAGAMQMANASAQLFTAGLSAMGMEGESVQKLQATMVQLIGVSQALKTVEELRHKQVLQGVALNVKKTFATVKDTIATSAAAKAEAARTAAMTSTNVVTKVATTVTWAWNAALAANPVVLILAGVVALGAGIYALTKLIKGNREEQEAANEAYQKQLEKVDQIKDYYALQTRLAKINRAEQEELNDIRRQELQAERDALKEAIRLAGVRIQLADGRSKRSQRQREEIRQEIEEHRKALQEIQLLEMELDASDAEISKKRKDRVEAETKQRQDAHIKRISDEIDFQRAMAVLQEKQAEDFKRIMDALDKRIEEHYQKGLTAEENYRKALNATITFSTEEEIEGIDLDMQGVLADMAYMDEQYKKSHQGRLDALKKMLDEGTIGEKQYHDEVMRLNEEQKNAKLEAYSTVFNAARKGFSENAKALRVISLFEQAVNLSTTIGEIAKGFSKNASSVPFPANLVPIAGFAAQTAGIVATIKSMKTPAPPNINPIKFDQGGKIFAIGGKPHSQGGTKFVGEDGTRFEAERDEAMVIINKHDTPMLNLLSDINSRHGRKFAQGGPVNTAGLSGSASLARQIVEGIGEIQVVVAETDITSTQDKVKKVRVTGDII